MSDCLIDLQKEYKTEVDNKNIDLNSDVFVMYSKLCKGMELTFNSEFFGLFDIPGQEESNKELTKEKEKAFQAAITLPGKYGNIIHNTAILNIHPKKIK